MNARDGINIKHSRRRYDPLLRYEDQMMILFSFSFGLQPSYLTEGQKLARADGQDALHPHALLLRCQVKYWRREIEFRGEP